MVLTVVTNADGIPTHGVVATAVARRRNYTIRSTDRNPGGRNSRTAVDFGGPRAMEKSNDPSLLRPLDSTLVRPRAR